MPFRKMIIASCFAVVVQGLIATIGFAISTPGEQIVTHWTFDGQPDGYMAASTALFIPVCLGGLVTALFAAIPKIEPLQHELEQSSSLFRAAWLAVSVLICLVQLVVTAPLFGLNAPPGIVLGALGFCFILIGNVLPKSRPGFFVGIRTPWTLTDSDNWIATHRVGSWSMIIGGIALLVGTILPRRLGMDELSVLSGVSIGIVPPLIFSFVYFVRVSSKGRRHGERRP